MRNAALAAAAVVGLAMAPSVFEAADAVDGDDRQRRLLVWWVVSAGALTYLAWRVRR